MIVALSAPEAYAAESSPENLADLSLEELGNIDVMSVSKKSERLLDAPASIFVITAEDIRRSGATSLPEALRIAPNLEVNRVNSSSYAISARGFNNSIGNKLLVLIDGRAVYTPLFSGVFWDTPDVFLQDVERIEVISGPGATLWGTNAVNGVINVITRRAADTQGATAFVGSGNLEGGFGARYGARLGTDGSFRIYGKSFDRGDTTRENGTTAGDSWSKGQVGFRADWGAAANGFTLQGDTYTGTLDQPIAADTNISGGNLLARWDRDLPGGGHFQLQGYFDNTVREIGGSIAEHLNIADVQFQHSLQQMGRHAIIWGGGYRAARDRIDNTAVIAFLPADSNLDWVDLFAQDEIALIGDKLKLTGGAKIERNPYTGVEFLPSVRLAWKPTPQQLVWSAYSRALRTPSRLDRELFSPANPPFVLAGGPDFRSEVADVYELGYKAQPTSRISYSVTVFHHIYDHLRSFEPTGTGTFVLSNKMEGTETGIEAWGTVQMTPGWRLSAGGFMLHQELRLKPGSTDPTGVSAAGNDPDYQWILRSSLDLPGHTTLDVSIRHVAELPNPVVPAYTATDMRLGWQPRRDFELSLILQNLFDPEHPEFGTPGTRSELDRGVYAQILWRF
ncbi:MAG: TonB-dependent receptor [Betaproteobacteria bacterium]|nr:TonB-dependent receptor [Betaproteobacteria bacterium]